MSIQVIGAGFGRTGTLSLKHALEILGFNKCYNFGELLENPTGIEYWQRASQGLPVNWDELFQGYQATVDFPGHRYYQTLVKKYPQAKVILTLRNSQKWYESALSTIYRAHPNPMQKLMMAFQMPFSMRLRHLNRIFRMVDRDVWQKDFQGKFTDKEWAIAYFEQHNAEVQEFVPNERLLVYQVKQGWEPLCNFLNVPIPSEPFPHVNQRETFNKQMGQLIKESSK